MRSNFTNVLLNGRIFFKLEGGFFLASFMKMV